MSDQRWQSIEHLLSDDEKRVIFLFNNTDWRQTKFHGAPTKEFFVDLCNTTLGINSEPIVQKLIRENRIRVLPDRFIILEVIV